MEEDKGHLIAELRARLNDVEPIPGEEDFFTSTETLVRYLKAREWNLKLSEKMIRATIEWRRKTKPLTVDCTWCHEKPGIHPLRQVGFDEMGRPVVYFCFAQATVVKNTLEQVLAHATYLIENAKKTMKPGVTTWVMVMDCKGISLPAYNPRLGYGATQLLSDHYPERLGMVICINHNTVFHGVWKAIKIFLHPNTIAKMKLVRSKRKMRDIFEALFPAELADWLLTEIKLNKAKRLSPQQRQFWRPPPYKEAHDPRGCPSYIRDYIEPYLSKVDQQDVHRPHPNIIDYMRGQENVLSAQCGELELGTATAADGQSPGASGIPPADSDDYDDDDDEDDDDDSGTPDDDVSIDDEFQIPKNAQPL